MEVSVAAVPAIGPGAALGLISIPATVGMNLLLLGGRPTTAEKVLQIVYGIRQKRGVPSSLHRKLERPIQTGQLISPKPLRLALP